MVIRRVFKAYKDRLFQGWNTIAINFGRIRRWYQVSNNTMHRSKDAKVNAASCIRPTKPNQQPLSKRRTHLVFNLGTDKENYIKPITNKTNKRLQTQGLSLLEEL